MNTPASIDPAAPWWRFGIVWLAFGLPAAVVVAAIATGALAWRVADTVVTEPRLAARDAGSAAATARAKTDALAPAVGARNHAATPAR